MREIPNFLPDLCALVWPVQCVGCGIPDRACCADCVAELLREVKFSLNDNADGSLLPHSARISSAVTYTGTARSLLIAMKHGGQVRFVPLLARVLSSAVNSACLSARGALDSRAPVYVVTLPSRRAAVRARGYAHLDLIVGRLLRDRCRNKSEGVQLIHLRRGLRATAGRRSQVGLRPAAREINAARLAVPDAARRRILGAQVILVDDIVTTGASLRCASEVLVAAGARVLGAATLCWVPRMNFDDFPQKSSDGVSKRVGFP